MSVLDRREELLYGSGSGSVDEVSRTNATAECEVNGTMRSMAPCAMTVEMRDLFICKLISEALHVRAPLIIYFHIHNRM